MKGPADADQSNAGMKVLYGLAAGAGLTLLLVRLLPTAASLEDMPSGVADESPRQSAITLAHTPPGYARTEAKATDTPRTSSGSTHTQSLAAEFSLTPETAAATPETLSAGSGAETGSEAQASAESDTSEPYLEQTIAAIVEKDRRRPRGLASLHDEFKTQTRDPEWADKAELQLARALIEPAIERGIAVTDIRCHQTLCEVAAQGDSRSLTKDWYHLVDHFRRRDRQFDYVIWDSNAQDGQAYMLTILERRAK